VGAPPPPPPRGYLPAGAGVPAAAASVPNGGYPFGAGSARYQGAAPASVLNAVRLMYAGAAYALIYGVGFILVVNAYLNRHPLTTVRYSLASLTTGAVFFSLIEIGLWLGLARACKRGQNWARITSTVLFGLDTLGTFGVLTSGTGLGVTKVLTVVSWLIACTAVVLLWQPPSNAFFRGGR
jgi:hypothetical protein